MFVVPNELRNVTHSNHVCVISTAYVHANHNGYCKNGPHCMWEAFFALHPYALNFKRCEIQKWLVDRQINCMHIDPLTGAQTNQLRVMVDLPPGVYCGVLANQFARTGLRRVAGSAQTTVRSLFCFGAFLRSPLARCLTVIGMIARSVALQEYGCPVCCD
jgi:hypothetical protein